MICDEKENKIEFVDQEIPASRRRARKKELMTDQVSEDGQISYKVSKKCDPSENYRPITEKRRMNSCGIQWDTQESQSSNTYVHAPVEFEAFFRR